MGKTYSLSEVKRNDDSFKAKFNYKLLRFLNSLISKYNAHLNYFYDIKTKKKFTEYEENDIKKYLDKRITELNDQKIYCNKMVHGLDPDYTDISPEEEFKKIMDRINT